MKSKFSVLNLKNKDKGQSFVELTLVLVILLSLLTGMIEFGNLLNQYITVVDAAREGARFGSNDEPFIRTASVSCPVPFCLSAKFFTNIDQIVEGSWDINGNRPASSKGALSPIRLRPEVGDDVVVSFFSIHDGALVRFPTGDNGWSYYGHNGFTGQVSSFTKADLETRLDATAPDTGMVLVEIYYNYDQILKFWSWIGVPDPIRVHAYAIMPLSGAEPTPVK
jgi:hypothetical protein